MNPLRAWSAFWFQPTSAKPLGLFRMVIGVIALTHLGLLFHESDYWLSDQGIYQGEEAQAMAGPLRFSPLQTVQDPASVTLFLTVTMVAAFSFTIGYRTKVCSVLLYLGLLSVQHRNLGSHGGPDSLLLLLVFYLMLSPCGAAYSLDARRRTRRRGTIAEPLILPWTQRLIQLQIALVYFNTVTLKVHGTSWLDGRAIHYVITNGEFSRFPDSALPESPVLVNLLTFGTLAIEFILPAFLWFRQTRPWAILLGVSLHLGIIGTMHINLFSEMMMASYLTFLTPAELQAITRFFRFRGRSAIANASPPGRVDLPHDVPGKPSGLLTPAESRERAV